MHDLTRPDWGEDDEQSGDSQPSGGMCECTSRLVTQTRGNGGFPRLICVDIHTHSRDRYEETSAHFFLRQTSDLSATLSARFPG